MSAPARILLAGATGVLGRRILPLLVAAGHHVTALTRDPARAAALRAAGAAPVVGDVFDAAALADSVATARQEIVVHQLTDLTSGSLADNARLRTVGTRHLVAAALAAGATRIVAQSISWAYEPGDDPAGEGTPLDMTAPEPRNVTVAGVAALEDAVRAAPSWVLLRYGMLYGPDTWYARGGARAVPDALAAGADVTSFVHVDDAASAAVTALDWPTGPVNVCDDEPAAGYVWVPEFCRAVGIPAPSRSDAPRTGWARGASNAHARHDLAWNPRYPSWRDGFTTL